MSVRIRLRRMGAKKQAFYRVVVADSRSPRDGRFLDTIGTYNPRTVPVAIDLDREKTLRWLEDGALPTDSARALLSQVGIWQEFKTSLGVGGRRAGSRGAGGRRAGGRRAGGRGADSGPAGSGGGDSRGERDGDARRGVTVP